MPISLLATLSILAQICLLLIACFGVVGMGFGAFVIVMALTFYVGKDEKARDIFEKGAMFLILGMIGLIVGKLGGVVPPFVFGDIVGGIIEITVEIGSVLNVIIPMLMVFGGIFVAATYTHRAFKCSQVNLPIRDRPHYTRQRIKEYIECVILSFEFVALGIMWLLLIGAVVP